LLIYRRTNAHTYPLAEKLLKRRATFDSFFYILGQLTRSPTKLSSPIFDSPPRHREVVSPAGPNDEAHLCVMRHFEKKIGLDNFEGTFAGSGKMRILSCSDETPRLNFSASVHVCVFVLL